MVAQHDIPSSIEITTADLSRNIDNKRGKIRRTESPTSAMLVAMLEGDCHNSFQRRPDEEPLFIWNTDEVEEHVHRMKKFDKRLARANDEIARLKEVLKQADEKHETTMSRITERTSEAQQQVAELKEHGSRNIEQQVAGNEVRMEQLQARFQANMSKISVLRKENNQLHKELHKKEKQMDKLNLSNDQLHASSSSLLTGYEDLGLDQAFQTNDQLQQHVESGKLQFEALKDRVQATQAKYMGEAEQRLELQKTMAQMIYWIQETKGLPTKLVDDCTEVGLEAEAKAQKVHEKLEAEDEWRNMYAAELDLTV